MNFDPERLLLSREQSTPDGDRRRLARSVAAGRNVRVVRGAYFAADEWDVFTGATRYLAQILATAAVRKVKPVFSHQSAVAIWRLPWLDGWPTEIHVTVPPTVSTRSRNSVVRHSAALRDADVVDFGRFFVTSVERTLLDVAASAPFLTAVVVADRALLVDRFGRHQPLTTPELLESAWARCQPMRAHARTRAVLSFAETRAESPLESVSRVNMRVIGVPRPRLQVPHFDDDGFIGEPDFTWDEFGVVGEADGDVKYLSEKIRNGRSAEQVVLDEKIREDRLRALPRTVTRWRWDTAMVPAKLRRKLTLAGLPTGCAW